MGPRLHWRALKNCQSICNERQAFFKITRPAHPRQAAERARRGPCGADTPVRVLAASVNLRGLCKPRPARHRLPANSIMAHSWKPDSETVWPSLPHPVRELDEQQPRPLPPKVAIWPSAPAIATKLML